MDLLALYRQMSRARAFELAQADLWQQGLVSGELHLGTGEEAVVAGVCAHLGKGDAVALDHRPTPVLCLLGVDLTVLLGEMLGREDGLCRGHGGHMHLFSKAHLAASSGIVGAAGPTGCGFALAARLLRPKKIACAFFGDGASNQGMLLESFNLAVAWRLPLLFVCKDNGWAITTRSDAMTGGTLPERAEAFGLKTLSVDGADVESVHRAAGVLIDSLRRGGGPAFLHATCPRLDGHMLGDPMRRMARDPMGQGRETFRQVLSGALSRGGGLLSRARSLSDMMGRMRRAARTRREGADDPIQRARAALRGRRSEADRIDEEAMGEMEAAVAAALERKDA